MITVSGIEIPDPPSDPDARREWKLKHFVHLYMMGPEQFNRQLFPGGIVNLVRGLDDEDQRFVGPSDIQPEGELDDDSDEDEEDEDDEFFEDDDEDEDDDLLDDDEEEDEDDAPVSTDYKPINE